MDFNVNHYGATNQLIADAIRHSEQHDETVEIHTPGHRLQGLKEELFMACEGHDDHGTYWGENWQVRLLPQKSQEPIKYLIEIMPEHHRSSHRAAGNWGIYPHNGAKRRIVGEHDLPAEGDEYDHVIREATEDDVLRYG